jgi:hypothetical protein
MSEASKYQENVVHVLDVNLAAAVEAAAERGRARRRVDISAAVPASRTSSGFVTLTATDQVIATLPVSLSGTYTLTHRLSATPAAGVVAAASRTLALPLVAY